MPPTTRKTRPSQSAPRSGGRSSNDKYAASAWGSNDIGGVTDLEVPSGQLCLVKRPGVEGLMREGVLRDIDAFTALVDTEHVKRAQKGKSSKAPEEQARSQEAEIAEMMKDPEKVANVMHTMDRVVTHVVIKPKIEMTPNDPTRRKVDVIYADMIDLTDKMFIFNFVVGGSRDIERFLEESDLPVGDVDPGEDVEDSTE